MDRLSRLTQQAQANPKNIKVKVECKTTGSVDREIDCGLDQQAADAMEASLLNTVDTEKFHVYQSYTS